MEQIATTIEQSKRLLELGLDPRTSDMCYPRDAFSSSYDEEPVCHGTGGIGIAMPAWSIGSLLSILRSYTDCNKLEVFTNRAQKWSVTISYYDSVWKEHDEVNINLMDSVVDTVVFLLENNYLTTENK